MAVGWALIAPALAYVFITDASGIYVVTWPPGSVPIQVKLSQSTLSDGNSQLSSVLAAMQSWNSVLGTVQLADFINPAGLQPNGDNLYLETASSGSPQIGQPGLNGLGTLSQGALESSNVNVVEQMVDMIETQRTYEMNSKAVSAADSMLQFLTNKT